jgi:hypothetical protein
MSIRSLAIVLLVTGCAVQPAPRRSADAGDARTTPDGLAALEGFVAGTDLGCVSTHELRGSTPLADGAGVLFQGRSGIVYLNRPRGGCPGLSEDVALGTSTPAGRLCAGDIVQAFDRASGVPQGSCTLGRFTPYRRSR